MGQWFSHSRRSHPESRPRPLNVFPKVRDKTRHEDEGRESRPQGSADRRFLRVLVKCYVDGIDAIVCVARIWGQFIEQGRTGEANGIPYKVATGELVQGTLHAYFATIRDLEIVGKCVLKAAYKRCPIVPSDTHIALHSQPRTLRPENPISS